MLQQLKRALAFLCIFALTAAALPQTADAATTPKFAKVYATLCETSSSGNVYTYTVKNISKGQTVKWSLSGNGKSYVTLKKKSTKSTGKKVSNKVTLKTNGSTAAKNKTVTVTAKVYQSGKLQSTLSTSAKIKILPTDIKVLTTSLPGTLLAGTPYQFNYQITPANATATIVWEAALADGTDASSCITKTGLFTPAANGSYTITARAKLDDKVIVSGSTTVTVATALTEVKQTSANTLNAFYSGSVKDKFKRDSFTLKSANGGAEPLKEISFSEDGTVVTITTSQVLKNAVEYTLSDGGSSRTFTAKVGRPVSMKVLTTSVVVNKDTTIAYALYDVDGMDVTAAYPGSIQYSNPKITNGFLTESTHKIRMTSINSIGYLTLTYRSYSDSTLTFTVADAMFTCVAAPIATSTNFTLTTSEAVPIYSASSYLDNRKVAAGSNYYIHFRALNAAKEAYQYDSIEYRSSDPDTLLINNRPDGIGRATAIKNGSVQITVVATYASQTYTYNYDVTITAPAVLAALNLSTNVIYVSSRYNENKYINVTAKNQFGDFFELSGEIAEIIDKNTVRPNLVTYNSITNQLEINAFGYNAGTYNYTLTLTLGSSKASCDFSIVIQMPQPNGSVSYHIDIDKPIMDMALTADTDFNLLLSSKTVNVRLAEYRGGVFYDYVYIQSAKITKDGRYYSTDLTQGPANTVIELGSNNLIALTTVSLNQNICTKAASGIYNIDLKFYPSGSSTLATINDRIELKDNQKVPEATILRTVANTSCTTALDLARNCITLSEGAIINCAVTGQTANGSEYLLAAGESVNIQTLTVQVTTTISQGQTILSNYTINLSRTLTNR